MEVRVHLHSQRRPKRVALLVSKEAAKHLGKGASIINIGSGVTRLTPPGSAVYTATKGAIERSVSFASRMGHPITMTAAARSNTAASASSMRRR